MKLLITTLTMIFISFGASGRMDLQSQKVDDRLCFEALTKGKIISYNENSSYTYYEAFYNNLYAFKMTYIYPRNIRIEDCIMYENP